MPHKDRETRLECLRNYYREHKVEARVAGSIRYKNNKAVIIRQSMEWQAKNPERYRENHNRRGRERRLENPALTLFKAAKKRCSVSGMDFSIEPFDVEIPKICPLLEIELTPGNPQHQKNYNPSIDRIDPTKGYVKGNIWVVSLRANRIKQDATATELERMARNLRNKQLSLQGLE